MPFQDISNLSQEAQDAINWGVRTGRIRGLSSTEYGPSMPVSRAQEAIFMYRQARWVTPLVEQYRQATVVLFNPNTGKTGAGLFINQQGSILTNRHVVLGADSLPMAWTQYIRSFWGLVHSDPNATPPLIVWSDAALDSADLAVIMLTPEQRARLPQVLDIKPLTGDLPVEGEPCVAIGTPLGYSNWVSTGHVACFPMLVPGVEKYCIGVTAGINPGNSGGPILSDDGHILGLAALKPWYNSGWGMAPGDDMGFGIPCAVILEWLQKRGIPIG